MSITCVVVPVWFLFFFFHRYCSTYYFPHLFILLKQPDVMFLFQEILIVFILGRMGSYWILRNIISMICSFLGWSASFSESKIKLNQCSAKCYNRLLCDPQYNFHFAHMCVTFDLHCWLILSRTSHNQVFNSIILAENYNFISFSQTAFPIQKEVSEC